jgi:hypothetical protein
MYIEMPFSDCISRLICISENGIVLLFYIFLSHGNEKKNEKRGVGCKKGDAVSCPQVSVLAMSGFRIHNFSGDMY